MGETGTRRFTDSPFDHTAPMAAPSGLVNVNIEGAAPLHAGIRARDGAVCIYAEKRWIALATMSIASLTDRYLALRFSALSTPGFAPPRRDWEVGVALGEFRFASDLWMGSVYCPWIIAFDSDVMSELIVAAFETQGRPADERAFALRARFGALIWPGPTGGDSIR